MTVDHRSGAASIRIGTVLRSAAASGVLALGLPAPPTMAGETRSAPSPGVVDDSYIVTLRPGTDPARNAPAMAVE